MLLLLYKSLVFPLTESPFVIFVQIKPQFWPLLLIREVKRKKTNDTDSLRELFLILNWNWLHIPNPTQGSCMPSCSYPFGRRFARLQIYIVCLKSHNLIILLPLSIRIIPGVSQIFWFFNKHVALSGAFINPQWFKIARIHCLSPSDLCKSPVLCDGKQLTRPMHPGSLC